MDETSPTRMNLLARRSQLTLAVRGVDLLQKKRDALVKEFFAFVHETLDARRQLNQAAREAHRALILAKSFDGPKTVETLSLSVPVISDVEVQVENIWGTRVPRSTVNWSREATVSPVGLGARTVAARVAFRNYSQALVRVANSEAKLRRIGEEIKKTARRVNALNQAVIPGIRSQIRYISQVLDQQEQEDFFRLKRIKKKLETQHQ
jgi:V/A-type H+-transporting ATPase subunit D